jgi:integrase
MNDTTTDPNVPPSSDETSARSLPALVDELRQVLRQRHYTARTERAYVDWVHRFVAWFGGRPPTSLGEPEMRQFLAALATTRPELTPGQRNLVRNALLTWFHAVLGQRLDCRDGIGRAQPDGSAGLGVLTRVQIEELLAGLDGASALAARLIYGTGLRLSEVVTLRVRDFDLQRHQLHLRDARTGKDLRTVDLPAQLVPVLRTHLETVARRHEGDLLKRAGLAQLPEPVRLSTPEAGHALGWQWAFQTGRLQRDPVSEEGRRPHLHETVVHRSLSAAGRALGVGFPVTPQTLRQSAAVHAREAANQDGQAVDQNAAQTDLDRVAA